MIKGLIEQSCRGQVHAVPVYTEDTVKGDRFIKDRQHVHFIYDGMERISKAGNGEGKDNINIYSTTLINLGFVLLMIVYDKENAT